MPWTFQGLLLTPWGWLSNEEETMTLQRWKLSFTIVSVVLAGILFQKGPTPLSAVSPGNLPAAIDLNPHPHILETNLVAKEAQVDLGNGVIAKAQTFNGTIPGPELRLQVGDQVIAHFTNLLPEAFTIHWHGIELNNASDGTAISQNPVK